MSIIDSILDAERDHMSDRGYMVMMVSQGFIDMMNEELNDHLFVDDPGRTIEIPVKLLGQRVVGRISNTFLVLEERMLANGDPGLFYQLRPQWGLNEKD